MRTRSTVVFAILTVVLVASDGASGSTAAKAKLVTTKGEIEAVAMDGQTIAYDLRARERCNTVHAWNVATGSDVVVSGAVTCEADSTSTGGGVRELAVAGRRVAWIMNLGGNTESTDFLFAATIGVARERKLSVAERTGDVDGDLDGPWLGNLHGDGSLIAVNRWTTSGGSVASATVRRVGSGLTAIHAGADSLRVVSVDSGRIAVLDSAGVVTVYGANGARLSRFTPIGTPREIALRKDYVVVLLAGGRLELHLTQTGALIGTIPVTPGARNLDVHANIAVYTVGRTIRAVRLATKKQAIVATTPKRIVGLALDDAGLTYAYNAVTGVEGVGKLTFVPLSLVQAKL